MSAAFYKRQTIFTNKNIIRVTLKKKSLRATFILKFIQEKSKEYSLEADSYLNFI